MIARRVIVTGADAGYFRYLERAVRSVRAHDAGQRIALSVFDLGLEPAQRTAIAALADAVIEPGWDYDLPDRAALPSHWRAYTARPHLPRHVPGYDTYMWLDADAWVQQWNAVDAFFAAAESHAGDGTPGAGAHDASHPSAAPGGSALPAVAIVPEVHPAYRNQSGAREEFETVIRAAFTDSFGEAVAARLYRRPHLNTGAFALAAGAPHWAAWSSALGRALAGEAGSGAGDARPPSRERLAEQCAMNAIVYEAAMPATFLAPRCNWICHHAAPRRDPETGLLTEPTSPFAPLGIVHETMWSKGT